MYRSSYTDVLTVRQQDKLTTIIGKLEALQQGIRKGHTAGLIADAKALLIRAQLNGMKTG